MARILSLILYALAAATVLAAIKVPALLMMAGFFAFVGYVVGNSHFSITGDFTLNDGFEFEEISGDEEESILSQKALGYGVFGSLERSKNANWY